MATGMTYAQVRDYVTDSAGDDCAAGNSLELLMVNCLLSMHNKLGAVEDRRNLTVTTSVASPTFTIPPGVDKVLSIVDQYNCVLPRGVLPCLLCSASRPHPGKATSWEENAGVITFHPAPDAVYTFTLETLGSVDCTLYTETNNVRNWRTIALPVALHTVYAKCVLGMALIDVDPSRAQNWMSIADQEFADWKSRLERTSTNRLTWSKSRHRGCASGCNKTHSVESIMRGY